MTSGSTSGEITLSDLTFDTTYVIQAFSNAANKLGSKTTVLSVTTDAFSAIEAGGGTVGESNINGINYRTHTFTSLSTNNFSVQSLGSNSTIEV